MKYEQIITLDFETYFDVKYSLKSTQYNTSEYIRDPQFKVQCLGIKIGNAAVQYFAEDDVRTTIESIDWSKSALLAHNTAFDGFILSHHFGVVPAYYLDTLSMSRAVHANNIRSRLDDVARFYGIGNKLPDILDSTKGVRDLDPDTLLKLMHYCAVDTELCYQIYQQLLPNFNQNELDLIDLTIRMFCDPVLLVDVPRAQTELDRELKEREQAITNSGVSIKLLRSANQFASELERRGAIPPTKISLRTGKTAYAFAKGDLDFQALLSENYDVEVHKLVKARIAAKSTINETRAIRFIRAGSGGEKLPVLLNYFGAHTSRWSAANKMNMQNLPRGGELRKSILAPPGYKIVSCDSSQIEARVLAWISNHDLNLTLFRNNEDVYKTQAQLIYNVAIENVTPSQRFVGKVSTLGLGFGMGAEKFCYTLAAGIMGPPVTLPLDLCKDIVARWRIINLPIPRFWDIMNKALVQMVMKFEGTHKCITWQKDRILLPGGIALKYPNLEGDYDDINARFIAFRYFNLNEATKKRLGVEAKSKKIYGGLMTENVVQALARIIVAEQMLKIAEKYRVVMMTHDEVVCIVKDEDVENAKVFMTDVMRTPPEWGQDIPLNAEIEAGATYG